MIHRHRPLRDGIERIALLVAQLRLQRLIVERQRIEEGFDALAQMLGGLLALGLALRRQPELLQDIRVQVQQDRFGITRQAVTLRPFQIALVPVTHVLETFRQFVMVVTVVLFIHLPLVRVRFALHELLATLAAPAGEETNAGAGFHLIVDNEILVVAETTRAIGVRKCRQLEARGQLDQHLLERFALAGRRNHRNTDGIHRSVEFGDRPVEHRHDIVPLQVGRVRQHQVGIRHHFRLKGIADNDERDPIFAVLIFVVEHLAHLDRVHGRVPRHVRHEDHERVELVRVTAPGIGDDVVHEPVNRQRVFPAEGLVDAHRRAIGIDEQIVRVGRPAERHAVERHVRAHALRSPWSLGAGRDGARERRLVAKAARPVDGAKQAHQDRQRANGMKTVRVRGQSAHGMKRHRVTRNSLVVLAPDIGPGDRQFDLLVAGGHAHFVGQPPDGGGRDTGDPFRPLRGVILDALDQQLERRLHRCAVGQFEFTQQARIDVGRMGDDRLLLVAVPPQFVLGIEAALFLRNLGTDEHAVLT